MRSMLSAISSHLRMSIALTAAIFASGSVFVATELSSFETNKDYSRIVLATEISSELSALVGLASDAEANQRGYLLTEREDYIDAYNEVLPKINLLVMEMRDKYRLLGDKSMLAEFSGLAETLREKLAELELTRTLAQQGKKQLAQELVLTGIGKEKADLVRTKARALQARHSAKISDAIELRQSSQDGSRTAMGIVTGVNMLLLVVFARWLRRDWRAQEQKQRDLKQQQTILDKLVVDRTQELEVLASHLQQVSEREKARIARELHDELGALLTASKMDVSWVRQHLTTEQAEFGNRLDRALKNLIDCVHAKRRVIENLVPSTLATFGLVVALREFSTAMQDAAGWALEWDLPNDDSVFPPDVAIALFRIVQESINNIAKYADAKTVWLRLRCDRDIVSLEVEDDGVGFDPAEVRPDSHGLAGMRQRMVGLRGTLKVNSEVGHGTRVCARLSLGELALQPSSPTA